MNLSISGHHLDVSPALRDYVTGKLERITRHFDQVIDIHVMLSVDRLVRKAEINLHAPGKDLHVESSHDDLYAAIDALVDKLDRQVIKYKEQRSAHSRDGLRQQQQSMQ
jgi:putative sigma-54 modulation protein